MNRVILIGNLARDPELKTTSNGIATCAFAIAVNRKFKNAQGVQEADFIHIVAWRQLAELCAKYLAKGRKVGVVGTLQTRNYTAQDGSKRYITEVVADEIEFLTPRSTDSAPADADYASPAPQPASDQFTPVSDDELPF